MIQDFQPSPTSTQRQYSPIRQLSKYLVNPEIINLGGGLPNPKTFPITGLSIGICNENIVITELELMEGNLLSNPQHFNTVIPREIQI